MKPREFDDLIRQKFDQNDFAYNPKNWDRLAEQMDGRAKKRSIIMWWIMPLAGVAASVALAMGVAPVLNEGAPKPGMNTGMANTIKIDGGRHAQSPVPVAAITPADNTISYTHHNAKRLSAKHNSNQTEDNDDADDLVHIDLLNAVPNNNYVAKHKTNIDLLKAPETKDVENKKKETKKEEIADIMSTFTPEAEQKVQKTSIILNGGYNQGNTNSGFVAGATIRRMVSDKVYIESDLAFDGSTNVQTNGHIPSIQENGKYDPMTGIITLNGASAKTSGARTRSGAKVTYNSSDNSKTTGGSNNSSLRDTMISIANPSARTVNDVSYNLFYAQVSPSIGVKISRKFSIGAGPDIQQAIAGKRPDLDTTDYSNHEQAPLFDLGLMAKTEYAITKKVKASIYYRQGINNLFAINRYTERNYLQFQLRCIIFNK